ncbi:MAG: ISAs1 family transposase [Micromonosporaceae bacterium]
MGASSLIEQVRCQLGVVGGAVRCDGAVAVTEACSLRQMLESRITDPRCRRGIRYRLASLLSVLIAGVACGYDSVLAIANAAAGWDQDVLAAHGVRINPVTGAYEAPSASTLTRLPACLDADELEAALSEWVACWALDPTTPARIARGGQQVRADQGTTNGAGGNRRRKPTAAAALARVNEAGHRQAAPGHPWLDPAVIVDSAHRPVRVALAVDGKERKLAKAGAKTKVHLLGALVHHLGALIGQDRVAKTEKTNEIKHFVPLLEPLPLTDVLITADAIHTQRTHARWLVEDNNAHYLLPVLGNQPGLYERVNALPWTDVPITAATVDVARGRIETRTIRLLSAPPDLDFPHARQIVLIERYVTIKKNRQWVNRNCEAVLYLTDLAHDQTSPADLLAHIRGHWGIEQLHWLRDVIWNEDKSTIRTGNAPQVMSTLTNLVITLFRLQGVTKIKAGTRLNAQKPHRPLQLLAFRPG